MVDLEMVYATLDDVKHVTEDLIVYIAGRVLENRRHELQALERDTTKLESVKTPFPRMSYDEAVTIPQKKGSEIQWGGDFGGPDETVTWMCGLEHIRETIAYPRMLYRTRP